MKKIITISVVIIVAILAGLGGWSYSQRLQITSSGIISISNTVKAADTIEIIEPENRRYYLCKWMGEGTAENHYRPTIAAYGVPNWGCIDLRQDTKDNDGYCIVYADVDNKIINEIKKNGEILYLGTSVLEYNGYLSLWLNVRLGIDDIAAYTIQDYLAALLLTEKRPGLCSPIVAESDGQRRIYLGVQIYGTPPPTLTHSTYTESFNKSDSTTLGPDLSWDEWDGTDWEVVSNQGAIGGQYDQTASPTSTTSSSDMYAQFQIMDWNVDSGNCHVGIGVRADDSPRDFLGAWARIQNNEHAYEVISGGAWYDKATISEAVADDETLYISVDGSTIVIKKNGSQIYTGSDVQGVTGNDRVGISFYSNNWGNNAYIDNLEYDDLTLPADISNTPGSEGLGILTASTAYYAYGSAPSNPVQDGECTFTITNNDSSNAVKIYASCTDFTGSGNTVELVTGSPSSDECRITVYYSGQNPASGVVLTDSNQEFVSSIAASGTKNWDFKFEFGSCTDSSAYQKSGTLTLTGEVL